MSGAGLDLQAPNAELLLHAYCRGIFPMANSESCEIEWYSPDPRAILPLEAFHVPASLARTVRKGRFELRTDTCFERVMRECAAPRRRQEGSWIDERLISAYVELHRRGAAHSLEAWLEDELVGGLYGVSIRAAFFGESMFSRPEQGGRDASKVALVELVALLKLCGFQLLDTQFRNPHLDQFGCVELPRDEYLMRLDRALEIDTDWPEAGTLDLEVLQNSAS